MVIVFENDGIKIEVDADSFGMGTAYFFGDDMGATISAGYFSHPFSGREYRVLMPVLGSKSKDAILMVHEWRTFDRKGV